MVPVFNFVVDITSKDKDISGQQFEYLVSPSLNRLVALKGAFDKTPCTIQYYPPDEHNEKHWWSVRAVLLISVGKERRKHLDNLCQSIYDLLCYELPDFEVVAQGGEFRFS